MLYHVARAGQTYGPYPLEDLQRYVGTGNVLPTDMARVEGETEWLPVSQVLGMPSPGYGAVPGSYAAAYPTGANPNLYADAPNLPWILVAVLNVVTVGLFMMVWNIVLSAWMKRVQPNSTALFYYIGGAVLTVLNSTANFGIAMSYLHHREFVQHPYGIGLGVASWVVRLIARYSMRTSLEEHFNRAEPVGLRLGGIMTYFFGGLYFQYHLNRINDMKRVLRFGAIVR